MNTAGFTLAESLELRKMNEMRRRSKRIRASMRLTSLCV